MPLTGVLHLIPSPLGEGNLDTVIPSEVQTLVQRLSTFIVERPKTTRAFLKQIGHPLPLSDLEILTLDEHTSEHELPHLLVPLQGGKDVGLLSEAGAPAVADPGANLIKLAHKTGIVVQAHVGPSAILLALMASGLHGQRFCFHGYLPSEKSARVQALSSIERESREKKQTQIFIETPYRSQHLFLDIIATCNKGALLCLAVSLTTAQEFVRTQTLQTWQRELPDITDQPTTFLLLA